MDVIERLTVEIFTTIVILVMATISNLVFNDILLYSKKQFNWVEEYAAVASGILLMINVIVSCYILISMVVRIFNILTI